MSALQVYEYAVVRVVPVLQREEFINAGIILLCKPAKVLIVHTALNEERLCCFPRDLDSERVLASLEAFRLVAEGHAQGGPIGQHPIEERFRWLTAVRSSAVQTSRPHPGLTADPRATALALFQQLVL